VNAVNLQKIINIKALQDTELKKAPYPHLVIQDFLNQDQLENLVKAFPDIKHRGSIPADSIQCKDLFKNLIQELEGDELRSTISEKFSVDLKSKPTMLTLRGNTTLKDGRIHTDSKSKIITVLVYMNPEWDFEGGRLRILKNNNSLENYTDEIIPKAGTCVMFEVTDNCWHGHTKYDGKRLSLQLNYLKGSGALNKHLNHHRITAWFKNRIAKFFRKN